MKVGQHNEARAPKAIGSVFEAALREIPVAAGGGLLASWCADGLSQVAVRNARAGLALLLRDLQPQRLWLPAYICGDVVDAARAAVVEVSYFPVGPDLAPDTGFLAGQLVAGDAILAVDYFGHLPPADFIGLVAGRPDCHWIEDRAQALNPGPAWGHFLLYSPRKIVGVPDGGILVARRLIALPEPEWAPAAPEMPAVFRRLADPAGERPDDWFQAFRREEAGMNADPVAISQVSRLLLERIDPGPIMARRRANARILREGLPDLLLWPDRADDGVPLGVPIRVPDAAAVAAELAGARIWCARHWPALPSPREAFPEAHRLSASLLTLPCDQRYDAEDMARIVAAVRQAQPR